MHRRADAGEVDRLVELDRQCFERPWSPEAWASELSPRVGEALVLLALEADGVLGYACAPCTPALDGRCELRRIGVLPEARGRGLARDLLMEVITHAKALECERVGLEVAADNTPALALYSGSGFRVVGRRPGYYPAVPRDSKSAVDALLLDLVLG